jgi:hypothetical protein
VADVHAGKMLRSMDGHTDRVSSLSWNEHILSSGGRDSIIVNHDVRIARHNTATLTGHTQEVCQLAWSKGGKTLASGGNDNKLCLMGCHHVRRRQHHALGSSITKPQSRHWPGRRMNETCSHPVAVQQIAPSSSGIPGLGLS